MNPTRRPPRTSDRSSTRSSPRTPMRSWAAAIIPMARRWRARCTTRKPSLKWISILVAPADDKFGELGPAALGVTVPSQWELQVSYKPRFRADDGGIRQGVRSQIPPQGGLSCGLGLHRRRDPAARHREGRLARHGEGEPKRSTRPTSRPSSVTSSSPPIPAHHGLQVAHEMVLAQWQKANAASSPARWSGPRRRNRPISSTR